MAPFEIFISLRSARISKVYIKLTTQVPTFQKPGGNLIKEIQAHTQEMYPGCEWLFPSRYYRSRPDFNNGKHKCPYKKQPVQDSGIKKYVAERMIVSGAGRKKIHTLRSTYATLRLIQLLRDGNPLAREVVQSDLNHRSQRTTDRYIKLAEDYLKDPNRQNVISSFLTPEPVESHSNEKMMSEMMQTMGINSEEVNWDAFWELLKNVSNLSKKAA